VSVRQKLNVVDELLVVGLSGVARSGKDEAAKILVDRLGFTLISLSEPMHAGLVAMNPLVTTTDGLRYADVIRFHGYERAKDLFPEVRRLQQAYGTEGGRDVFGEDCWVDLAFKRVAENGISRVVIPNIRFANEANAVIERSGVLYRIRRPGVQPVNGHISDNALTDDDFDLTMTIENNREIQDLHRTIMHLVSTAFGI
jgi:hypothetical protein